jgi:hypothetical protein
MAQRGGLRQGAGGGLCAVGRFIGAGVLSYGSTVRAGRGDDDSEKWARALVMAGSGTSEGVLTGCEAVHGADWQVLAESCQSVCAMLFQSSGPSSVYLCFGVEI